jgi:SPP1 family predicted phage head-tail adaptor
MRAVFVDPGRFRTELVVEAPEGDGGDWIEVATVMAHVEPVTARARPGADQTIETVTHRITLRFRTGIGQGMRMRAPLRAYTVESAFDPDETRRYLVCTAREERP